jgi:hypothetical protein
LTVHALGTGTIVSPCDPSVSVRTAPTGTASFSATKYENRAVSSMPAWPSTRLCGKPVASCASVVISSSGLDTTTTTALGAYLATFSATPRTIPALRPRRSMRDMPGLRGRPAVITTMSEPSITSYPPPSGVVVLPTTWVSKPSTGRDWLRSSARPSAQPSLMSVMTTFSKMSYSASRCAVVDP